MQKHPWLLQLDRVEQQFNAVAAALIDGTPETIVSSSGQLQQLALQLHQLTAELGREPQVPPAALARIKTLSRNLPLLRESLLRRNAYVERALQVIMPSAAACAYPGRSPYGAALRVSGELKVLAA
ncbi:MAG: hypothetical protein ACR2I0_08655 [Rhodoferax sp.]